MKSYLKLLLATLLALTLIFVFASCDGQGGAGSGEGGGEGGGGTEIVIVPNPEPATETYLVDFVYRYTSTSINGFDRMETKEFNKRVKRIEIPVNNSGLSAEQKAEISALLYNGYGFEGWYSEWDSTENTVSGEAYDFAAQTGAITGDMVFYGNRGLLAGANATWAIDTVGEGKEAVTTLTISGTGSTFDFAVISELDIPWYAQRSAINRIVLEEGITGIGANSFNGLNAVTEVVLPSTLVSIGDSAFRGTSKLRSIVFPDSLKSIGASAFASCGLRSLVLNEGLETIGESAFNATNKIEYAIIPSTLVSIGSAAFHPGSVEGSVNSHSLSKIFSRGDAAHFAKIDIGLSNDWFTDLASIYYTAGEDVDVEATPGPYWSYVNDEPVPTYFIIKYMLNMSIYGIKTPIFCDYVRTSVSTDDEGNSKVVGVVSDANEAYPKSIVYHNFEFVSFDNAVKSGSEITGDVKVTCQVYISGSSSTGFLSKNNGIRWAYDASTGTITISTSAKQASESEVISFLASKYSVSVSASTSLASVLNLPADEAEKAAAIASFVSKCLEKFSVGDASYVECATVADLAAKMAQDQSALGVFKIWDYATPEDTSVMWAGGRMNAKKVNSIVFSANTYIEHIGSFAFANLTGVSEIYIPATVKSVDVNAFSGCSSLKSVYYEGTDASACIATNAGVATEKNIFVDSVLNGNFATVYAQTAEATSSDGNYWMKSGKSVVAWKLSQGVLTVGGPSAMVDFAAAADAPWYGAKDSITSVVVAAHISAISENLVNDYAGVTSIKFLGGGVRSIPKSAFAGTGVLLNTASYNSKGLLIINDYLLATNTDSALVEIPFYTIAIAEGAFDGCSAISELYIPSTVLGMHANVFSGKALTHIYYKGNSTSWKALVAGVTLPEGVKICLFEYDKDNDKDFYQYTVEDGSYVVK